MNNARRKLIDKSLASLQEARDNLQAIYDKHKELEKHFPDDEEFQDAHEDELDEVDTYFDNLEEAISSLNEAINTLEGADF